MSFFTFNVTTISAKLFQQVHLRTIIMNMTSQKRLLTGVKPTGLPHIGNYFGAIKPAIDQANTYESFLFIADYHALTTFKSAQELTDNTLSIAAAWLALGLDSNKTVFYQQSTITAIFECAWILSCFCPKGLLNRAHAYKAATEANINQKRDIDHNINAGIFNYPILMAADILLFQADKVPVGADQKQHVEIARDIAAAINKQCNHIFNLPQPVISKTTQIIVGIDGQKMSKNYNNTIPIFLPEKQLRKRCMQIVTDSTGVDEPKDPTTCNVFNIFKHFLNPDQTQQLIQRYHAGGVGYGTIKQELYETLLEYFKPARDRYQILIDNPDQIRQQLIQGQKKAQHVATTTLTTLKKALGILA